MRAARVQAEAILEQMQKHDGQGTGADQEETERLISYLRQIAQSLTVTADQYATKHAPPSLPATTATPHGA